VSLGTIELVGFAGGREIEVPCDKVDAKLNEIWRGIAVRAQRETAVRSGPGARIAVHRACLLNLVVHAGDAPSEIVARFLTTSLTDRIPARVILIRSRPGEAAPDGKTSPRAFVSAAVNPVSDGHGPRVAGELVILEAHGAQLDRIPAVVRAVLEPDMATTLWWTGPVPPARPWVRELHELASRVVIDTEELPDDVDFEHLLPATGSGRLADLTWPRLDPWRIALARAFDDPANRSFLADVDSVRIGLAAPSGTIPDASAAPLLAGWLAAALGWRACVRRGEREVCFAAAETGASSAAPSHETRVTIEPRRGDWRGVVDVELAAGSRVLRVRRTPRGTVECEVPPGFRPVRPAPFREVDPVDVLAAALLQIRADPIAPESIRRASEMASVLCGG